ncbi:PLP-dependent aminotransferase family protein [Pelagimonas varians]|uniref:Putative HTH-type transcriptional regulator YdcR n=1 Tax=Pelagimonas varians TaxID=696760 RepID=A0A238KGB5_9RHOB|nr:PLP-dependent aminotransferase family protein [Pelagimonas varians]PYG32313.1 GntR family transcriptional regulator [Pelagimonas varians]SMX41883.1 putative HTH-type transcriptional regulator YdcR [Pelagimonas varians]
MTHWTPTLRDTGMPRYIEIAEAIKSDIDRGALRPGDRLPPQRALAQALDLDFSTISRAYSEATRRGYAESFVGRGTFVSQAQVQTPPARQVEEDPMMNMPPEPDDPDLLAKMRRGLESVAANLVPLMRYQSTTGLAVDKAVAAQWLQHCGLRPDTARLTIAPGSHAAIYAILSQLADPGLTVLCEDLTYPGIRAIAANLGLHLIGVQGDIDGICPQDLDRLIQKHRPVALYLNPTLQNPTTQTMPQARRKQVAAVLMMHDLPLIEDDAYCCVPEQAPQPISTMAPGLGWHVAGLSKVLGAGLRLAYITAPKRSDVASLAQVLRTQNVMASPLSLALVQNWIETGTAAELQAFVRGEMAVRQTLASKILKGLEFQTDPQAYNLWLTLPPDTTRAEVMGRMAGRQIGLMPSDAFCVKGSAPDALRVCLGGPIPRLQLENDLMALADAVLRKDWLG